MRVPPDLPNGFVALTLAEGCAGVISERVYVAGVRLGTTLRRREAMGRRTRGRTREDAQVTEDSPGP